MKKKLLTLLALLTTMVSGAWGDTELVVSNTSAVSETFADGSILYSITSDGAINSSTKFKTDKKDASNDAPVLSDKRFVIKFPVAVTSVKIYGYNTNDRTLNKVSTATEMKKGSYTEITNSSTITTTSGKPNYVYTVSWATPIAKDKYIWFEFSNALNFYKIEYTTASTPTVTALWDWQNEDLSAYNVNESTEPQLIPSSGLNLTVLPATSGAKAKLTDNGSNAQMNENTAVRVPVASINDIVTIISYPDYYHYNVSGVAATNDETIHKATMKEVAQGYVEIVATSTAYLYSIEVKQYDKADEPTLMSLTANETTYYADELTWTESPSGTFSTTIYVASLPTAAPTAVAYNGTLGSITYSAGVATIPVTLGEATATYVVTFSAATVINVVAGAGGSVSPEGEQAVENGDNLTITATPNAGYAFENWTKASDGSWSSTTNPLTIENITASDTYTANFIPVYKVTYSKGAAVIGTQTSYQNSSYVVYADKDGKVTMPKNYAFVQSADNYRDYTMTKWKDANDNYYTPGETYTLTSDITVTPYFESNTVDLANSKTTTVATWLLDHTNEINVQNKTGYYVTQVTVNGVMMDVPMYINNTTSTGYSSSGKFTTTSSNKAVQARNTKLTIPAINGMTVVFTSKPNSTYVFRNFIKLGDNYPDGSTASDVAAASATYTYTGENGTVDICFYTGNDIYLSSIVVTYPVTASAVDVNVAASGYTTYASGAALDFANAVDGDNNKTLKAYVVSEVSKEAVTLTEVTSAPANTGVVLKGTASTSYSIPVTASPANVETNLLTPVVTATTVAYESVYVVSGGKFCLYQGTEIPAGKAYLEASLVPTNASMLNFDFGSGTTAIDEVRSKMEDVRGDFYNLNGQRVAQPTKGLYIVNGRKVIMK